MSARVPGPRFVTEAGIPVFLEPSHALPLVDVEIVFRLGAITDPEGREGLTRMAARLARRGPRGMSAERFDETLDALGATLGMSVSTEWIRMHGSVIRRNLEPYLELFGRVLTSPGMRAADFARLRRKTEAELVQLRDHDRALAARAFRHHIFGQHLYGRPVSGTLETVSKLKLAQVKAHFTQLVASGNLIVGLAGDVTEEAVRPALEAALSGVPKAKAWKQRAPKPRAAKGRRVLVIDKPERTQTQLYVGGLGLAMGDPDFWPLLVANTAFGGAFTSRLVHEVRSERGWSYGASSKVGVDRQPDAFYVWTHPGAEQAVDCLKLELELLDDWVSKGLTGDEIRRSKQYLKKSHAFDLETAAKRLDPQIDTELFGLDPSWLAGFRGHVGGVSRAAANDATSRRIPNDDLSIALLATADDDLVAALQQIDGVRQVDVISHENV
ncbi:MAG: pitrilysin family protein [Sandaracinaceae bacterium]